MDDLFKEREECIRIYIYKETIKDPYSKSVTLTPLKPIKIKVIASDLIASQIAYKLPGITTTRAKSLIVDKKYRTLLEKSHKIEIDNIFYEGWRVNGQLQIRQMDQILQVYVYSKTT